MGRTAANFAKLPKLLRRRAHTYSAKASINRVIGKKKIIAATNVSTSQVSANRQSGNCSCRRLILFPPTFHPLSLLAPKMAAKRQDKEPTQISNRGEGQMANKKDLISGIAIEMALSAASMETPKSGR